MNTTTTIPGRRYGSAVVTTPSDCEIEITRVFDAPAARVYAAWTTPDHVRRWWGSPETPLTVCEIDLRVGGSWRYAMQSDSGVELGWHGTYREIVPTQRLVSTEVFEGYPDGEALNTLTLTEADGVTTMLVNVLHTSRENRDGHINSGMEAGMQLTLNRVDDLLPGLSDIAENYRRIAGAFTKVASAVPADAWSNPAPCDGWVARDVIAHMTGWMPAFLDPAPVSLPTDLPVDTDPAGAWITLNDAIQALLDDPATAAQEFDHPHVGRQTVGNAIGMFFLGDVLVHTWDLARATGGDETLDAAQVHAMYEGLQPIEEILRSSGQYGPAVPVSADADEQTKLIAFTGRQP